MSAPRRDPEVDAVPFGAGLLVHHRRLRRVHVLNSSAAAVWLACDGERDEAAVVAALGAEHGEVPELAADVRSALEHLRSDALVVDADRLEDPGRAGDPGRVADPELAAGGGQGVDRAVPPGAARASSVVRWRVAALGQHAEITCHDPDLATRLDPLLAALVEAPDHDGGPVHRYDLRPADPGSGSREVELHHDGAVLRRGSPAAAAHHLLWHLNHEAVERYEAHLLLHAGAVAGPAGAVLVVGAPDAGKSTLAAAAVQAGLAYLTDEAPPIEGTAGGPVAHPYPKPLALDRRSLLLLGLDRAGPGGDGAGGAMDAVDAMDDLGHLPPAVLGTVAERPAPVAAVVVPDLAAPAGPARPLGPADAALQLAAQAFNLRTTGVEGLATLAAVASSVPVLALPSRDLPGAVATVLGLAGARSDELRPRAP